MFHLSIVHKIITTKFIFKEINKILSFYLYNFFCFGVYAHVHKKITEMCQFFVLFLISLQIYV